MPEHRVAVEPLLSCGHCYVCEEGSYYARNTLGLLGIDADGGSAEYVTVAVNRIYRIPESLPVELACMVEPAAVAVHAVRRSRVQVGTHSVVLGAGPICLLVAQVPRVASAAPVEVVEVSDYPLEAAQRLGFEPIDSKKEDRKEAVLSRTEGKGADVLFDVAGVLATTRELAAITRAHGQVAQVAMPKDLMPVDLAGLALREIDLMGCRVYDYKDYRTAIDLIARNKIDVESLVTHVLPLDRAKDGLDLPLKGDASVKVLLDLGA